MKQPEKPSPSPETSTPGRPHDTSRQQKHADQNLDSGSETLDKGSSGDRTHRTPIPPNAK